MEQKAFVTTVAPSPAKKPSLWKARLRKLSNPFRRHRNGYDSLSKAEKAEEKKAPHVLELQDKALTEAPMREKKPGFWKTTFQGFLEPMAYFKKLRLLLSDLKVIWNAIRGKNFGTGEWIFTASSIASELSALAGRTYLGAYLSTVGIFGTAAGAALGGYLPAMAMCQVFWAATSVYFSAKNALKCKQPVLGSVAASMKKTERNIGKMIVRGTLLNLPFYGISYLIGLGSAAAAGTTASIVAVNIGAFICFVFFTALALRVNSDVIREIAEEYGIPVSNTKKAANL